MNPRSWSEVELGALGPDEFDFQEFKGSWWLDQAGTIAADFQVLLSKQISAFANGAGGRLVIGVDDAGEIDGGVLVDLKNGGTRSWLEDIVPGLVDPPLARFNVHEVLAEAPSSRIGPGRAVYVVEIPSSDSAPHQSLDHRYYLRIAGKSRPMGHVHVKDVLRRTSVPVVRLLRLAPFGSDERITTDPRGPKALLTFRAYLSNEGRTMAHHVGVEAVLPRPLVSRDVRQRTLAPGDVTLTQRPGTVHFFRYHPNPMFPGQDLAFLQIWMVLHSGNIDAVEAGTATVRWRVYADDAPASSGEQALHEFSIVRSAIRWLRERLAPPSGAPPAG